MNNVSNFEKLKYEQDRVLKSNHDAQQVRERIKEDYVKLQTKLQTLPDVVSEDAMVPIGNVAFFPGHLIHTNEITVLLGDNWFVERSAKQSIEIIERRIKMVEKQLSDLQKEETRLKDQKGYTNEFLDEKKEVGGIKEIQEVLTEESMPRRKGTDRKAHVPKHCQVPRSVKFKEADQLVRDISKDTTKNNTDTIDHDELLARLNELEREEQEVEEKVHAEQMKRIYNGEYMNGMKIDDDNEAGFNDDMESNRRHVKFKTNKPYESDEEPMSSRNVIRFTHTPFYQRERSASESDLRNTINSPADVFQQFASRALNDSGEKPLKSILKKDSRSNSSENLKLKPILKTSPEHQPGTPELPFDEPRPILKTPPDSQGSDRRPGTPEYLLNDDPKPILKTSNGNVQVAYVDEDYDLNEPRTILKFVDSQYEDSCVLSSDCNGEEMRSILKTSSESFSPEHSISLQDITGTSKQENRRPILKSPDNVRSTKIINETIERKPILKNTMNDLGSDRVVEKDDWPGTERQTMEAVSNHVVERTGSTLTTDKLEPKTFERKPISKFKASRSRR